ncbi:hypothetical protein KUTeg_009628 [Tegillarca granosa]|uniref:Uncharacterized protein n=1 Tax=Tegillarca granosa TaxID=220873 RepID=A0ABQ9F9J0_TEGGR|nr:hypothetical protein KUTeg_009628 [Tegillarca granosa]
MACLKLQRHCYLLQNYNRINDKEMTFISVESQERVKTKIFLLFMTLVTVLWIVYLLHDKNYYYKLQRFKPEVLQTSIYKNNMLSKSAMCKKVELSSRPLTKTALASFPGSGNTWIRHLIQQSTESPCFIFKNVRNKRQQIRLKTKTEEK